MIVFLVDIEKDTFEQVGNIDEVGWNDKDSEIYTYCNVWQEELIEGKWLFIAEAVEGSLRALWRATYSDYDLNDPFYVDVAESDERFMFANVISSKGFLSHI